jgi:hypothetical protein
MNGLKKGISWHGHYQSIPFVAIAIIAIVTMIAAPPLLLPLQAYAQNPNPTVLPIQSNPFGKSYAEWSATWWKWANSIPSNLDPIVDQTGENCDVQQSGKVWFLAGSEGETVVRECTIPQGKAILFPIISAICYQPADAFDEEVERENCANLIDLVSNLEVTVDGKELQGLNQYRVQSPVFTQTLGENNPLDEPAGTTIEAVADGYWIMLTPLPRGEHEIHFIGEIEEFDFTIDVTYHITVQ